MIKIFRPTDTVFASNGDVVLKPLRAVIHKQDNGGYWIDVECGLQYAPWILEGNIIAVDTPQGDVQAFRITNPKITEKKITVKANHVFFDSKNYLIADSYVEDKTGDQAIRHLNSATQPRSEFTVSSDVTHVDSYRCVRTSLYDAIMTMVDRWGGHLVLNNFEIKLQSDIARDNGINVQYRKNIREITVEEVWDNVVTKILPVGKDGILLNAVNPSASIYLTSSTQYAIPYTKTVSFEQDLEQDDYSSETAYIVALVNDLRTQATKYLAENCVPKVNYTLQANLKKVTDIGDIIHVMDERLNLNLLTSVISYEYDCLSEQFTEIEFGNFKRTLSGLLPDIRSQMESAMSGKQNALISGLNIKTLNAQSLLGSGNITIDVDNITNSDIDQIMSS